MSLSYVGRGLDLKPGDIAEPRLERILHSLAKKKANMLQRLVYCILKYKYYMKKSSSSILYVDLFSRITRRAV